MTFDPKTIEALAQLRVYTSRYPTMGVSEAINTLDNAGVFAALDEQTDYADAVDILAESAVKASADITFELNRPDPAEWGDTTAADMARHQGLTGTGHDRSVCDAGPLASPSQHSGACPTWARHHNLTQPDVEALRIQMRQNER